MSQLALRRQHAQGLVDPGLPDAPAAVRWLAAVQSQDYVGAKWALGQRVAAVTDAELDRVFDAGAILRTHVLRPTWHFVAPEDARWMLELTGPRVLAGAAGRFRRLGLEPATVLRAHDVFADALSGGAQRTRAELGAALAAAGISPEGQRLPHLLMSAELERLLISGARRGRQHTYALFEDRAPAPRALDREAAVVELARRYFRSRGPAQLADFTWWSGLSLRDARLATGALRAELDRETVDGREYWFDAAVRDARAPDRAAHLLPNFDEYLVAYRDREAALHPEGVFDPSLFSFGSVLSNVVTIAGRVRGAWSRTSFARRVRVELRLLDRLDRRELQALEAAAARMAAFLGRPVELATPFT